MMQLNGKSYHTLDEAAEEFGYTKGTLYTYITQGTIDGERMEDGQWFISEVGWVQLKRRRKIPVESPRMVTMEAPESYTPPEPQKPEPVTIDKTHGSNGQSVHFTTDHAMDVLGKVRTMANTLEIPIKVMTVCLLERGLDNHELKQNLSEIEELDNKRSEILKRMGISLE